MYAHIDNMIKFEPSNVTIRPYRLQDIPLLVQCAAYEIPRLPNMRGEFVDPKRLTEVLTSNVNNDGYIMARVLCDSHNIPVGGIMGYCVQKLYSYEYCAGDVFLFIEEHYRTLRNAIKLIEAYKAWALARKASPIIATFTSGYKPNQMDKLIKMLGFETVGQIYYLRKRDGYGK